MIHYKYTSQTRDSRLTRRLRRQTLTAPDFVRERRAKAPIGWLPTQQLYTILLPPVSVLHDHRTYVWCRPQRRFATALN